MRDINLLGETEKKVIQLFALRHGKKDVSIFDATAAFRAAARQESMVTALLGAIGAISVVAGGVGVMNIMLVTVSERAREIGVRIAVGARQSDISRQFLIEAVILCLIGPRSLSRCASFLASLPETFCHPAGRSDYPPMAIMVADALRRS